MSFLTIRAQRGIKVRRFAIFIDIVPQHDETAKRLLTKFPDQLLRQVVLRRPAVPRVTKHHKGPGGMHGPAGLRC
jgi:hypothetical protein